MEAFLADMYNNVGILVGAYFVFLYSVILHYTCNSHCIFLFIMCSVVFGLFESYFVLYLVYLYEYVFLYFVFLCFGVLILDCMSAPWPTAFFQARP